MEVEITGLDAIAKKLRYIGVNTEEIVDRALHKGAIAIQADAKRLVPKKTGRLAGSISVEKITGGYSVGTNIDYGPYVELGTGTEGNPAYPHTQRQSWRYMDENGNWHYVKAMRPRPYMQPAFSNNQSRVVKIIRNDLWAELKKRITR
ncbi:MAG: HK97-gp10 family putative phage morphogenesis protein [Ruminiclostridium sp.]